MKPKDQPPYQARHCRQHGWNFVTATGVRFGGFPDRFTALKQAANQERADCHDAEHGTGAVSIALQKHFQPHAKQIAKP